MADELGIATSGKRISLPTLIAAVAIVVSITTGVVKLSGVYADLRTADAANATAMTASVADRKAINEKLDNAIQRLAKMDGKLDFLVGRKDEVTRETDQ